MEYTLDRYNYYTTGNKVIAVSTYAGRTVRGVAKCDPRDEFSLERGKKLAAARCNEKVAIKRAKRAIKAYVAAIEDEERAVARTDKMSQYVNDASDAVIEAAAIINDILHAN